jgi:transposase
MGNYVTTTTTRLSSLDADAVLPEFGTAPVGRTSTIWGLRPRKDVEMPISEAVTKRRRRSFSPEFKREIVALCQLPDNTVTSVCKEYDLGETAVRRWVHQAEVDAGVKPGVTTAEAEELARLRKQLRDVTEERDILARAVGFFAKGTR